MVAFSKKATIENPRLIQESSMKLWDNFSGEPLLSYYKTNYMAFLSDGKHRQYSSLRYFAQDYDAIKARLEKVEVIDASTQQPIDATKAYFLVNSKVKGTFSRFSKLAFKNEIDAKEFQKIYGGDIREFDFVLYVAIRDVEGDKEADKSRIERLAKRGKKIYEKACSSFDINSFYSIASLKAGIIEKGFCKKLNQNDFQALAIYLWEHERFGKNIENKVEHVKVPNGSKCPVCGMFVYKYPKWAATITHNDGHIHYFDGVKDMMKFYFSPKEFGYEKEENLSLHVSDYYTLEKLEAKSAWYVLGSRVYGPMGHELIPFKTKELAESFSADYRGKKIVKFDEITKTMVLDLDK